MARRVLLVDWDVDALGALASALRARGLTVANANEPFDAVEQAFELRPDVVLAAKDMDSEGTLTAALRAVPELADTPLLLLVDRTNGSSLASHEVLRGDIDHVVSRITQASPRDSRPPLVQEIRGNLQQMALVDLLQLLTMNRRSGVLMITTTSGAGEVRLAEGEVIDAVFRRLEGEKALYRLFGEREGHFSFTPGEAAKLRRIESATTSRLLMEGMRQVDEIERRRRDLAPSGEALLLEDTPSGDRAPSRAGISGAIARELATLLQVPRSIEELLDEIGAPDLAILEALTQMAAARRVRRIPISELTTPFGPPEQLPVLRSLVTRLARPGFSPPPRLILASKPQRIPALTHAVRRIMDAVAPAELPPRAPLPRTLATLRLGDGVELAVTGLPADEAFAPTWALTLPGASAVVRIESAGGEALEALCGAVEVMMIEAESVMGAIDVAVPAQIAALLRSALELAAGV
jgi:CheY-like chemotaxis protein